MEENIQLLFTKSRRIYGALSPAFKCGEDIQYDKAKFSEMIKSKTKMAQTNELLCKLITYNITVLISAIYELKIEPKLIQ